MDQSHPRASTIMKPGNSTEGLLGLALTAADVSNEDWRMQLHKLQYEVDSMRQERDATALRHDDELRRIQSRADADYKLAQTSEASKNAADARFRRIEEELRETEERLGNEKVELEGKLRIAQDEALALREEVEDVRSEQSSAERHLRHDFTQLDAKHKTLVQTLQEIQQDREDKARALETVNQLLSQREAEAGELESTILRLKASVGDVDTLAVIKRELSQQVDHIKQLEASNLDQRIELKQLRKQQKAVEVVEEEKRVLETKVRLINDLRKELGETQLQKQILEDERRAWTAYLDIEGSSEEGQKFDTPEDLAKAFIAIRLDNASLVDKLGKFEPELAARDSTIESLEKEHGRLLEELKAARMASSGSDLMSRSRLERHGALALKEVEFLRAQLRSFDAEEREFRPEEYDELKSKRIQELEDLVDKLRREMRGLQDELLSREKHQDQAITLPPQTPSTSLKRSRGSEDDERLGELSRRNRSLQDQLAGSTTTKVMLEKELEATKIQLTSLKSDSRTRILEYRNNPTASANVVKATMLSALREENSALLSRLESTHLSSRSANEITHVPTATLERLRLELAEKQAEVAAINKKTERLKQVWGAKSREWRQTVASTLGWDFDFMPNGRVRVTSSFNPGTSEEEGGEGLNSIIFDGEKGTMKCSGGPRSAFAAGIDEDIRFWVDDKREVPCFLATLTLKFWDETTKAQRVI